MKFSLVLASGDNNAIGYQNRIPWDLPKDRKVFQRVTMGKVVVMGRKTWQSLPMPVLPGRRMCVISRTVQAPVDGVTFCTSLQEAAEKFASEDRLYIIGGSALYEEAAPLSDEVHITDVYELPEADTFFDLGNLRDYPWSWSCVASEDVSNTRTKTKALYRHLVLKPA